MQPTGPTAVSISDLKPPKVAGGCKGTRAVIEFTPKPGSTERICAGVVLRLDDGSIHLSPSLDARKASHAFGSAGTDFFAVTNLLCLSLADHWKISDDARTWAPPFHGASIAQLSPFSATSVGNAFQRMLDRTSSLHTLIQGYEIKTSSHELGIMSKVQSAMRKNRSTEHLSRRFNRQVSVGELARPLRVDFLGQNFACYFLQISQSERALDRSTERAFGKLYELQALRRFVKAPKMEIGLLEDEKPNVFELLMVGNTSHPIQRQAIYQVEALADKNEVRARILSSAKAAAEHVAEKEKLAA